MSATSAVTVRLAVDASAQPCQSDVLDRFTQAWGDQDLHQVSECLHLDVTYCPSVGSPFVGVEKVLDGIASMWAFDSGSRVELGLALETGNLITRTWTYHFDDRPPTNGVDIFTFHDGLSIEKDAYRRIAFDPQI